MISRRIFIKNTAKASLFSFFYWSFGELLASTNDQDLDHWKELVEYARWCPTVHNLQPHKLKVISSTEAQLYYDPSRLLPVGDPDSVFATVALGIFIEHLSVAASFYGKRIEIKEVFKPVDIKTNDLTLFATLKLVGLPIKEDLSRDLILKRRTSRLHYDGNPLKQITLDKIKTEGKKYGHEFYTSSDKELIDLIIEINQETLFYDLNSKAEREELDRLFRYTKQQAETKRDGLWARCMGFPGRLVKSVFRHHQKWEKGMRKKMLASYYSSSFKGTSTICWITGAFDNTAHWLDAGRMLARMWLTFTAEGAYIHPLGSLITNVAAYKKINEKLETDGSEGKLWFLFRAGYSHEPARSYRLNTDEILFK
jgi:hypothetical protein